MLTAHVSPESYRGWQDYADAHQVTMTALAEAVGLVLPAGLPRRFEDELLAIAVGVVAERKSRLPPPSS